MTTAPLDRAALGVEASCGYLAISRPTMYRLLDAGAIRSFHIGRRRLILREDLDKFVQERLVEAGYGD